MVAGEGVDEMTKFLWDASPIEGNGTVAASLFDRSLRTSPGGEPRGIFCAMGSCHECRATVDGRRGVRTCLSTLAEGMSVDREVSLEPAEVGNSTATEPQVNFEETDLLVVGAGPAGIAAAVVAAEAGIDTLVIDEGPAPGGRIWADQRQPPPRARVLIDRAKRAGVRFLAGATVISGTQGSLQATTIDGRCIHHLDHHQLLLATGSRELFLPFRGWTLPGVVGVGALQALLKGGLDVGGKRVGIAGSGPLLLEVAALARRRGAQVKFVLEQAPRAARFPLALSLITRPGKVRQALTILRALGRVRVHSGAWVTAARGDGRLQRVKVRTSAGERSEEIDILATGFGLVKETRIARALGCEVDGTGAVIIDDSGLTTVDGILCAGEPTGIGGVDKALAEGSIAGHVAAGLPVPLPLAAKVRRERAWGRSLERSFPLDERLRALASGEVILCRCEDVSCQAVAEASSLREAKLLHRLGMGACQGRVCFPAGRFLHGWQQDRVRPPWSVTPGWTP